MQLFDSYLNGISEILENKSRDISTFSKKRDLPDYFEKSIHATNESVALRSNNEKNKVLIEFNKNQLEVLFGENEFSFQESIIGTHPDFQDLAYNEFEKYYCVALFMDIKGSTRLNEKYNLFQIRKIKDTILTLAIHISSHFGGHVHRLQGDGIFLQFVRKNQKENDAVINALNTASVLTYFISTDLSKILTQNGVNPLSVRIGIDLGYKDDVIWSHYGIPGCSELTTTSFHTDLAAKLQAQASSNGILVGNNIKQILDIKPEFCEYCKNSDGQTDYYIYQGFINYNNFNFNWVSYLKSFDFINRTDDGLEIRVPNLRLKCYIVKSDTNEKIEYYQNSKAIEKESSIEYHVVENGHEYYKKDWEIIEWKACNTGQEATDDNNLAHDFEKKYNNQTICKAVAKYKGHHHIECTLKRNHLTNVKLKFPIFVE